MKFGVMVATKIDDWQLLPFAESIGFDSGWVPEKVRALSGCLPCPFPRYCLKTPSNSASIELPSQATWWYP